MTQMAYIGLAMFLPIGLIAISLPFITIMAQQRNMKRTRSKVQVVALSDNVPMEYYLCDKPINGSINIYEKPQPTKEDGTKHETKEKKLIGTLLAIKSHPGVYPPNMWKKLQVPITEYFANADTGSFVPVVLGGIDPLESAMALGQLANERTTSIVVRESKDKEVEDKKAQRLMRSLESIKSMPMLLIGILIATVAMGAVNVYMTMGLKTNINAILDGLKAMGVIH